MQPEQQLQLQPFSLSIGTGDQANLAYGLALFPVIGAARAGISNTSRSNTILDFEFTIVFSRTKFHSYYSYLMGALGPAISFELPANVTLTNSVEGGQVAATLGPNQQMVAGLVIGVAAGAGFTLTQQFYLPERWYSPWKWTWRTVFQLTKDFEVDLLTLLLKLIEKLVNRGVSKGTISKATGSKLNNYLFYGKLAAQGFSFYDINDNGFGPQKRARADASLTIPIDLVTAVPALRAFVAGLSKLVGQMEFGPQFTVLMPVELELNSFVLKGAQGGESEAVYGPISYQGSTAIAKGSLAFTTTPNRFTTKVTYTTRFTVALSFFFSIRLCKLYSYQWTSGSLDLLALLNLPIPTLQAAGSVAANVSSGCVLIPQMTLEFITPVIDPYYGRPERNNALSDVSVKAYVTLAEPWAGQDTHILIAISPAAPGFPSKVALAKGQKSVTFDYTFSNRCIVSGDPEDPDFLISPTTTSPYQSYLVSAKIDAADPKQPCADWEVAAPVKVCNRAMFVSIDRDDPRNTSGDAPAYNPKAGAQMNAAPLRNPTKIDNYAKVYYGFPFATGTGPVENVPVSVYLLDGGSQDGGEPDLEGRKPASAHLKITFDSGATAVLTQPASLTIPLSTGHRSFRLEWVKASPEDVNFSSLFILVIDGGCGFGQVEFWVNAWNWA